MATGDVSGGMLVDHGASPDDKLGYSRHYAERIRDLGKTSKESWIKRLWNHMFGSEVNNSSSQSQDSRLSESAVNHDNNSYATSARRFTVAVGNSQDLHDSNSVSSANVIKEKEVRFTGTSEPNDSNGQKLVSFENLESGGSKRRPASSTNSDASKDLPVQLVNSPYLPTKDKIVYYRPVISSKSREDNRDGVVAAKLRYQKMSSSKGASGSLSSSSAPNIRLSMDSTNPGGRRTNQSQSLRNSQEIGKAYDVPRSKVTRDPALIQLEKRAKVIADRAIKSSKIFTCNAPYPVDVFVRLNLRERGWVEKFGPRVTLGSLPVSTVTTDRVLQCKSDKDYEEICKQTIPKPWEEDQGILTVVSRCVHRYPAKFMWAGKSINSVVLKNDVIVNHFPKAKYFSSKVLLATSLRDLPWHNNSDSMSFFPRCYLLNDNDKPDIAEDFLMTACIALLKLVLSMHQSGDTQSSTSTSRATSKGDQDDCETIERTTSTISNGDSYLDSVPETNDNSDVTGNPEASHKITPPVEFLEERTLTAEEVDGSHDNEEEEIEQDAAADIIDDNDDNRDLVLSYEQKTKVVPDLQSTLKEKKGGNVPVKAVDWAIQHCYKYLRSKNHEDLDKSRRGLTASQLDQLLSWYYEVSQEGATVQVNEDKLTECRRTLEQICRVWPQYYIDGCRNLWIVKPGDKSKGIGISFCNNLNQILSFVSNPSTQGYIVQKYIERPLLVYKCKFDVRQWFLVTDWLPLTIWFYKDSYLRICSQEFSYDSMHESIHLSNVAVQENYVNGKRSSKLPENNFMTSEQFKEYLSEIGEGEMWDKKIYSGMKAAVVNTLVATQEFTDSRKNAFELYGADFMMSEDYTPWLLEINSSPGMLPSSIEKAKLCATVISDTIKVVLDRRENSASDTGHFELVYCDSTNPNTRGTDTKLVCEGQRIKKPDLQRYAMIDQKAIKLQKDREAREAEKQSKQTTKALDGNSDTGKSAEQQLNGSSADLTSVTSLMGSEGEPSLGNGIDSRARPDSSDADQCQDEGEQAGHDQLELFTAANLSSSRVTADLSGKVELAEHHTTSDKAVKTLPGLRKSTVDIYAGNDRQGVAGLTGRPKPLVTAFKGNSVKK